MKLSHHFNHNFLKYMHTDLAKLESFVFIHNLGRGLIGVFIPIILLISGFSISQVLIYLMCYGLFDLFGNFTAREAIAVFGVKKSIIFSVIVEIAFFISLIYLKTEIYFIIILALLMAIYDSFFWVGHWLIFNETIYRNKEVGKRVGFMNIVKQFTSLVTPVIGAIFLIFFNKDYLILLAIFFLFLSFIPLLKISDKHVKAKKGNYFKNFKDKDFKNNFFILTLLGIHYQVEDILLPIFIYLTFSSIESVGILPLVLALGSIIFTYFISKFVDKIEKFKIIFVGSLALMIVWILRLFFPMIETFFLSAIFVGFFVTMIFIPVDSLLIKSTKGKSFLDVSTHRNNTYMWLNFPFYLTLYLSVEVFKISFATSALAMFLMVLISQFLLRDKINKAIEQTNLNLKKNK